MLYQKPSTLLKSKSGSRSCSSRQAASVEMFHIFYYEEERRAISKAMMQLCHASPVSISTTSLPPLTLLFNIPDCRFPKIVKSAPLLDRYEDLDSGRARIVLSPAEEATSQSFRRRSDALQYNSRYCMKIRESSEEILTF